jgi:spectinomycin phosphotransferase
VLTQPDDLSEDDIRAALAANWNFRAAALSYRPVGFGSHHWLATDAAGRQLFLTVHDLTATLTGPGDTTEAAYGRLQAAFECAVSLRRDERLDFVIAPLPAADGRAVGRLSGRYTIAVCPYLADCVPGHDGEFALADRPAVLRMLVALHRSRPPAAPQRCDFALNADGLRAALASLREPWSDGPYGERARGLLARQAAAVTGLMKAYDELVLLVRSRARPLVVTHGEPGAWNTLKTPAGFVIVDWDSVRLAPPERDLWELAETDGTVVAAYTQATGTAVDSDALALFRMWYDLSEIAEYICLFRDVHTDTEDAGESWKNLKFYLRPAERWPLLQLAEMSRTTPRRR